MKTVVRFDVEVVFISLDFNGLGVEYGAAYASEPADLSPCRWSEVFKQ